MTRPFRFIPTGTRESSSGLTRRQSRQVATPAAPPTQATSGCPSQGAWMRRTLPTNPARSRCRRARGARWARCVWSSPRVISTLPLAMTFDARRQGQTIDGFRGRRSRSGVESQWDDRCRLTRPCRPRPPAESPAAHHRCPNRLRRQRHLGRSDWDRRARDRRMWLRRKCRCSSARR